MAFAEGYTMAFKFNLDGLGITYISLVVAWTLCLIPGAVFLTRNRTLPYLRIRNIPLAISSVATLHVYWVLCMTAYVLNGYFPCSTEFWIMSIYLPLGIALYHAANTQLLYVAGLQKKYASTKGENGEKRTPLNKGWRVLIQKLGSSNATKRAMTLIGIGMIAQFLCSLIIFLVSRKFHPGFGVTGHEVSMQICRRGWEWWPSIVWQFFWAWVYAPYLLWKVRRIADVHGWRRQTALCAIAGLPASPMWLIALYVPAMKPISNYLVPPLWFSPSIVLMQAFVIFAPCIQVYKNRRLESETRQVIAEWEHKRKYGSSLSSGSTNIGAKSRVSYKSSTTSTTGSRHGEMYTLHTLEKTLQLNSKPLLLFAALKDFSGENISFLTHVGEWKAKWTPASPRPGLLRKPEPVIIEQQLLRRQQFNIAVEIYLSFVSLRYSDFPINLSSAHLKELEALFDGPAAMVASKAEDNAATPFDSYWGSVRSDDLESSTAKDHVSVASTIIGDNSMDELFSSPEKRHSLMTNFNTTELRDKIPSDIEIPDSFNSKIFDCAEKSIKELVLTNTWPKFVNAGFASNREKQTLTERFGILVDRFGELYTKVYRK